MIRVGTGISLKLSAAGAAREAVGQACEAAGEGRPDLALVFVTAAWGAEIPRLLAAVRRELGDVAVVGCSVDGLWRAGAGTIRNPGLALATLRGASARPVLLTELAGHELEVGDELEAHLGGALSVDELLLFFADAHDLMAGPLLAGLRSTLAGGHDAAIAGLGASAIHDGGGLVWLDDEIEPAALAGVRLSGLAAPGQAAARPYRVLTPLLEVTRARGNWIFGLGGRPALEVYRELAGGLGMEQWIALMTPGIAPRRVRPSSSDRAPAGAEGLVERGIIGLDPERGAISVPAPVESGVRLAFALLDGVAARQNLESLVAANTGKGASLGLFLAGSLRGSALFGGLEGEARCLTAGLPETPMLGLHGAYRCGSSAEAGRLEAPLGWSSLLVTL